MKNSTVFLIGGAPGVGKTTLGCALASKLGIASVTIDDLLTVAQTVTTPQTHPELHVMRKVPHLEYFTHSSIEQLKEDVNTQHEASWPLVEALILKHARWEASSIVIDGWHLRPKVVAQLELTNLRVYWIVASASVLEERESKNLEWIEKSSDPKRMLKNFLDRSLWFNDLIKEQASELCMNVLDQQGKTTVEEMCELILGNDGEQTI